MLFIHNQQRNVVPQSGRVRMTLAPIRKLEIAWACPYDTRTQNLLQLSRSSSRAQENLSPRGDQHESQESFPPEYP